MRFFFIPLIVFSISSCTSQVEPETVQPTENTEANQEALKPDPVWEYYFAHAQDSIDGKSIGTVSNGSLENGSLIPFSGDNYRYFDTSSYLSGRAFSHQRVVRSLTECYAAFYEAGEARTFRVMECSNEHGGRLFPHRTHQNGLSVDLMTPLLKNGERFEELDNMGLTHYSLAFNDDGELSDDPNVTIDFDMIAQHLLALNEAAKKNGLKITKVIFKMELKDELYASVHGTELKNSGIYITKNLSPLINELHDDHYHVDFAFQ
ncbi:MAG: penicillin-insensitive murein endopeptidase [Crocinitomicaceae bacterium]|nr:penicillin-insensitive murein endopeptidase [Crocinitomicaceae bacterium]